MHNHFTALFTGPSGWAGARRELLDFMAQGRLTEADTLTIRLGDTRPICEEVLRLWDTKRQMHLINASFFSWADHNIRRPDPTRIQSAACRRHRQLVPTWEGSRPAFPRCRRLLGRRRAEAWTTSWHRGRSVCDRSCRTASDAMAGSTQSPPQHPWQCRCRQTSRPPHTVDTGVRYLLSN